MGQIPPAVIRSNGLLMVRCMVATLLAGLLAACGGDSAPELAKETELSVVGYSVQVEPDRRLEQIREVTLAKAAPVNAPRVRLSSFSAPEPELTDGPTKIGISRPIQETSESKGLEALMHWRLDDAGKQIGILEFESPDAQGIRLGLNVTQLPMRTVVRIRGNAGNQAIEIDSAEIVRTIQANLDAGVTDQEARLYWLPIVKGSEVALEIELPVATKKSALKVQVTQLIHLWDLPESIALNQGSFLKAASCRNNDANCATLDDSTERALRAVARMSFVDNGIAYLCSGVLLNDWRSTGTPYFMTSARCITTQSAASTLETDWHYRSATCGHYLVNPNMRRLRGGATLLYQNIATDTSFMRLNDDPPANVFFAGWSADPPKGFSSLKTLFHPSGDLLKVLSTFAQNYLTCPSGFQDSRACSTSTAEAGTYFAGYAPPTFGSMDPGSIGAPAISTQQDIPSVIGHLSAPSLASCGSQDRYFAYARFDRAYEAGLKNWLGPDAPAPSPYSKVFRFYNSSTGAHFYTNSILERDFVLNEYPVFAYEGPLFRAAAQAGHSLSPVFRFFNTKTGAHFYTISAEERDYVLDTYPEFTYEGPSWYAQAQAGNSSSQMHRFFNTTRGVHFYTINQEESDFVRSNMPEWSYEGGVYYAWPK